MRRRWLGRGQRPRPAERSWGRNPARAGARQNWYVPELPEVESLAVYLRERVAGRVIDRADSAAISVLKTYRPDLTALRGRVIDTAERHGKFLDLVTLAPAAGLDGAAGSGPLHLVMHLARAGWLRWRENLPAEPPRPGKGPLAFRLRFTDGAGFDLTEAGTQIKGVLRDQKINAGIGNAYSDEVLHAAKMSPFKLATSLTADEVAGLHEAIITCLRTAIARSAGLAAGDLKAEKKSGLQVHGRAGQPCPVCGDTVREVSFADSALQYCPTCQTGGRPLADRRMSRLLR